LQVKFLKACGTRAGTPAEIRKTSALVKLSLNFATLNLCICNNPDVIETLEEARLKFVARDESGRQMEVYFAAWIGFRC
jgi:hypothetical protein